MKENKYHYSSISARIFAFVIDNILVDLGIIFLLIFYFYFNSLAEEGSFITYVYAVLALLIVFGLPVYYFTYMHGKYGQTLAKKLFRIKVVQINGASISYNTAFGRTIVIVLLGILSILGLIADIIPMLVRKDRRTLHDLATGTMVIKVDQN